MENEGCCWGRSGCSRSWVQIPASSLELRVTQQLGCRTEGLPAMQESQC